MSEYVTHDEFNEALTAVYDRIEETEERAYSRTERHLTQQDTKLTAVYNWTVFGLFGIIGAIIVVAGGIIGTILATR